MLVAVVAFHVLVQIPAGLLGARLARNGNAWIRYATTLTIAGALTALTLHLLHAGTPSLWADFTARGALGLAAYVWLTPRRA
ncbi:hypothetical protein ABZ722_03475 [Streptomyces longwoodensis]|uniref:hypothetical protein n=1 Tax=Streptomyces longwoodensis TaxID=68231 RepID=UPI0033D5D805